MENKFGKLLIQLRLEKSVALGQPLPARAVARALGVSSAFISQLETGKYRPGVRILGKIVSYYPKHALEVLSAAGIRVPRGTR